MCPACRRGRDRWPDGNRGSRSDHGHGVVLPQTMDGSALDRSVDRHCHHACSPSQAFRACRAPAAQAAAGSVRKFCWRSISAQPMRAILSAKATATSGLTVGRQAMPGQVILDTFQTLGTDLRRLTELPGKPAVVVPVHPTRNADREALLPRCGGAFLNEVDANLTLWADIDAGFAQLHRQGKLRGPGFRRIGLDLRRHPHPSWQCPSWSQLAWSLWTATRSATRAQPVICEGRLPAHADRGDQATSLLPTTAHQAANRLTNVANVATTCADQWRPGIPQDLPPVVRRLRGCQRHRDPHSRPKGTWPRRLHSARCRPRRTWCPMLFGNGVPGAMKLGTGSWQRDRASPSDRKPISGHATADS